jgi:hypothetical protein
VECNEAFFIKDERDVLGKEFGQGTGDFSDVFDESMVESCMA